MCSDACSDLLQQERVAGDLIIDKAKETIRVNAFVAGLWSILFVGVAILQSTEQGYIFAILLGAMGFGFGVLSLRSLRIIKRDSTRKRDGA